LPEFRTLAVVFFSVAHVTRKTYLWTRGAALLSLVAALIIFYEWPRMQGHNVPLPSLPAAFLDRVPARVLWAWEEPEDLHTLSPSVGVAYLTETDILTDHIVVLPRRQPLSPAPGASLIAVVRIETRPGFRDTPALRAALAAHLATYGIRHDIRALQLDFDATQSQHDFYRGVLEMLRPELPRNLPLSITALVSWCGPRSWLHELPIDEAVPMEFRMGGPRALALTAAGHPGSIRYPITEPLCRSSVGLSTDEPWPASFSSRDSNTRVYLFAPRPWRQQELASISTKPLELVR
jgi:hypothetical protein